MCNASRPSHQPASLLAGSELFIRTGSTLTRDMGDNPSRRLFVLIKGVSICGLGSSSRVFLMLETFSRPLGTRFNRTCPSRGPCGGFFYSHPYGPEHEPRCCKGFCRDLDAKSIPRFESPIRMSPFPCCSGGLSRTAFGFHVLDSVPTPRYDGFFPQAVDASAMFLLLLQLDEADVLRGRAQRVYRSLGVLYCRFSLFFVWPLQNSQLVTVTLS